MSTRIDQSSDDDGSNNAASPLVVGIGGSAGALPALIALLEAMGEQPQLAVVVVLHLSPDHESHSVEILQRATPLVVSQVTQRTKLEGGHLYVIAPGTSLITQDGHVQPGEPVVKRPSSVIDLFFRSLGEVHRERAVGVILSGTGRDGSLGLMHIKEFGGLTLGQALDDCEHPDMPRAAEASGSVDLMLTAAELGRRLSAIALSPSPLMLAHSVHHSVLAAKVARSGSKEDAEYAFQDILTALRLRTRHDFRHYKRATLLRRLERRIQINELSSIPAYRDFVRAHPEELIPLLADMLISVTNFFRDPHAFETLQKDVIPQVLESVAAGDETRVWIPACASGEESYSVAIALQEQADELQQSPRLRVFASDINEAALNVARTGVYPTNIAADVSETRLRRFFEEEGPYRVRSTLREMIVFARHNLLSDPPFSRLDLICCRNLLIYLDRAAQAAVLNRFAYALKPGGYLFLGNAESTDAAGDHFEAISKEHRIYRLRPGSAGLMQMCVPLQMGNTTPSMPPETETPGFVTAPDKSLGALHEKVLAAIAPPSVLISTEHDIERVSHGASRFIAFGEGAPTRNLLNNVPADIRVELRALLFRANADGQPVETVLKRDRASGVDGVRNILTLSVHPVQVSGSQVSHWLVLFEEKAEERPESDNSDGNGEVIARSLVRRLEDENRSLKSHLQDTLDHSAVANEELQASNEELQAINEELRSAKEELETSKEELQSVNEELTTVNTELRMRVDEGARSNDDLRNLMEASDIATVLVDSLMRVKRFTPQASKLFSLIASDLGRPLMDVKSRLHYDEIVSDATSAFKHLKPIERSLTSVDGEHFLARVVPYRPSRDKIGGAVLTFIDVTELRLAEQRMRESEERLRSAIASSRDFSVISTDETGMIVTWNEGAQIMFGYTENEAVGESIDMLFTESDRERGIPEQERRVSIREGRASDERWHLRKDGTVFFCSGVMTTASVESRGRLCDTACYVRKWGRDVDSASLLWAAENGVRRDAGEPLPSPLGPVR